MHEKQQKKKKHKRDLGRCVGNRRLHSLGKRKSRFGKQLIVGFMDIRERLDKAGMDG